MNTWYHLLQPLILLHHFYSSENLGLYIIIAYLLQTNCNSIQKIRLMVRLAPFKFHILINGALAANLGDGRASV